MSGRERRDDLRDVLFAFEQVLRKHYPHLVFSAGQEQRIEHWHAMATKKSWLRGMEEGVRDIQASIRDWSVEARREFLDAVRDATGQEFAAISGGIEKAVAKLLKKRQPSLDEFDLRLLRDYVSDYPDGALVEQASAVLQAHGEP